MSRRMDREGVHRMEPQGIKNRRFWDDPRCVEDANGWVQPFTNWQGWDEFNHAVYALHCVLLWKRWVLPPPSPLVRADGSFDRDQLHRGSTLARIESDLRSFHSHIAKSRRCDRPVLP
jgi:hypothetical protein